MLGLILLSISLVSASGFKINIGDSLLRTNFKNIPFQSADAFDTTNEYFDQQIVDHFDAQNADTWSQNYYLSTPTGIDTSELQNNHPMLFLGGEGPMNDPSFKQSHALLRIPPHYTFSLIHRYYNNDNLTSNPTPHFEPVKDGRLFSSEQALEDVAHFIQKVIYEQFKITKPPIVYSCSYPGSLTVWFRYKYPHLSLGAIGFSAPIVAQDQFPGYALGAEKAWKAAYPQCFEYFATMKTELENAIADGSFSQKANICPDSSFHDYDKLSYIYWNFMFFVASGFAQQGVPSNVEQVCSIMSANGTFAVAKELFETKTDCKEPAQIIQEWETAWQSGLLASEWNNWFWQKCSEFGWFKTNGTYLTGYPLPNYFKHCQSTFHLNSGTVEERTDATNFEYGGLNIKGMTNMLILNGEYDPWHMASMPVYGDDYRGLVSRIVPKEHHCAGMQGNDITMGYMQEAFDTWLGTGTTTSQPTTPNQQTTTPKGQPTTSKGQPTTSNPQPTTSNPQPTTSKPQPTTSNGQPTTSKGQPTTSKSQPTTTMAPRSTTEKTCGPHDIVFLVDVSQGLTQQGLTAEIYLIHHLMGTFKVGQDASQFRVGLVEAGETTKASAPLTKFNSNDELNNFLNSIKLDDTNGLDLADALTYKGATSSGYFGSTSDRSTAPNVAIVLTGNLPDSALGTKLAANLLKTNYKTRIITVTGGAAMQMTGVASTRYDRFMIQDYNVYQPVIDALVPRIRDRICY